MTSVPAPVLQVENLRAWFRTTRGVARAVDGVSFSLRPGRTLGVVGESGCGKSVTARCILGLLRPPGRIEGGRILFRRAGRVLDLAALDPRGRAMRELRGNEIAMIFQEPMTTLNPVFTIGAQIVEAIRLHEPASRSAARQRAVALLDAVGMPSPQRQVEAFPHELSGGMRQRAVIAMALACNPAVLIADEPTTALDVTIQAQVLDLLRTMKRDTGASILFITHDLGVIAELADDVLVMYLGRVVERGPVRRIFHDPRHPYTRALLASSPSLGTPAQRRLPALRGNVPSPYEVPSGCAFRSRCSHAVERCRTVDPPFERVGPGHAVACHVHASLPSHAAGP